jgi:hypothetical protein
MQFQLQKRQTRFLEFLDEGGVSAEQITEENKAALEDFLVVE